MTPRTVLPLEASTDIAASPAAVWALVSDLRQMTRWSPETVFQAFTSKQLKVGARSVNLNKRKGFIWPTSSRITAYEPGKKLSFYVALAGAQWTYELEPIATGTRLTERRELRNNKRVVTAKVTARLALGGAESHDVEILEGMNTTLARIKAEVEA